jgi:hypothetical protein
VTTGQPLPRPEQHGAVLAEVKAKPSGWPAASLDNRLRAAPNGTGRGQDRRNINKSRSH